MPTKIKWSLRKLLSFMRWETEDRELLQSVAQKVMGTTLAVYVAWHIVATLVWPETFSPSLYLISLAMLIIGFVSLRLLERYYLFSQLLWNIGLGFLIITAYHYYHRPEIVLLFIFLPIMAEVMM